MLESHPKRSPGRAAGLVASVLLNLALFAFVMAVLGRLPDEVPLHFDQSGITDRTGSPFGLLILPLIGLIAWILAALIGYYYHQVRRDEPVAYIVWGATVLIEVATWVGLLNLVL